MAKRRTRKPARGRPRHRRRRAQHGPLIVAIGIAVVAMLWAGARLGWFAPPPLPTKPKLTMAQARAINAAIPFAKGGLVAAPPFRFKGTPAAREQAIQCLATAALYEAGSDRQGQKAVIQVILNRVRSARFPKTVCGVVYQGSARPTGCQFSFTCDGSEQRRPEHAGWLTARAEATRALSGHVFGPVGTATHYHADWMVPYWIGSLAKIARIHTHIFYREPLRADAANQAG